MLRFIFASLVTLASLSNAAPVQIASPDGAVQLVLLSNSGGELSYEVRWAGQARIERSRLGILVDGKDLGSGVTLGTPKTNVLTEVFPWRGNKTSATNRCVSAEVPVRSVATSQEWFLDVRAFNDGVAIRYRVPGSGERKINGEATSWHVPADSTLWLQTDTANYEGAYHSVRAESVPVTTKVDNRERAVFVGPPVTIEYADGKFGLITEAALRRYSGMTLRPAPGGRFTAAFEDDPNGWTQEGMITSPWRVVILTPDLHGLVNSDVVPSLCDPPDKTLFPEGMNTSWIRPGKAPCTWMVYGNDGAQWDRQKWFVDVAAATGCEYLLVDAGWRTEKWGWMKNGGDLWQRAAELCKYAAERNVWIVLWHAYPEGRDDGPGLTKVEAREELFRNCQKAGVKGIKIDFFDSESKQIVEACEDLATRAAKYQLLINFHGANKPTGEPRTWPNEITREGIREQEYVLWGELPLEHYGALPFTRMAVGHADFLPGYVQSRFLKNTSVTFQMAATLVFSSPFLCWPDNPEAYMHSPLLQFVRTVPVTWDETRILPGSAIGKAVVMARRKGADWYVAGVNCEGQRALSVDLSFAASTDKELLVYREGADKGSCTIETASKLPSDGKVNFNLQPGGGFIIHLRPQKSFAGWK